RNRAARGGGCAPSVGTLPAMVEPPVADAGREERIAQREGIEDVLLEPDEGAVGARWVHRILGTRVRLHRVDGRRDGVRRDVVIEVAVAQHALHDVREDALAVRAVLSDRGAAGENAARAEPDAYRSRVTRRHLSVGDGLEERYEERKQHEARLATDVEY